MSNTKFEFDSVDSAASYLYGLPSHGGYSSLEQAKESASDLIGSGVFTITDDKSLDTQTDIVTNNFINENDQVYNTFDEIPENQLVTYDGTEYRVHKIPNSDYVQLLDKNGEVALTTDSPFNLTPVSETNSLGTSTEYSQSTSNQVFDNLKETTNANTEAENISTQITEAGISQPFVESNGYVEGGMSAITDKSNGTKYYVVANINNEDKNCVLIYGDEGEYYLVDAETGQKYSGAEVSESQITKIYNTNAYKTKADGYSELSDPSNSLTSRLNGYGTADRPDIHDNFMHHTHITQRADLSNLPLIETGGSDNKTYSSFDAAVQQYMTQTGESEVIAKEEVQKAIDSGGIKISDSGDYSYETSLTREDAIQKLTNSGQWLRQDAEIYVDTYAKQNNITFKADLKNDYFNGTKYQEWYEALKDVDCKKRRISYLY